MLCRSLTIFLLLFSSFSYGNEDRDILIFTALKYEGIIESGKNNTDLGGPIDRFHRMWGFFSPSPWCGLFVGAIHKEAKQDKYIPTNPAWSPSWSVGNKIFYKRGKSPLGTLKVNGGDVFTLYYQNLGRVGHVGFILRNIGSSIETIEGNTGAISGTRESLTGKDGVFKKIRKKSMLYTVGYFGY